MFSVICLWVQFIQCDELAYFDFYWPRLSPSFSRDWCWMCLPEGNRNAQPPFIYCLASLCGSYQTQGKMAIQRIRWNHSFLQSALTYYVPITPKREKIDPTIKNNCHHTKWHGQPVVVWKLIFYSHVWGSAAESWLLCLLLFTCPPLRTLAPCNCFPYCHPFLFPSDHLNFYSIIST